MEKEKEQEPTQSAQSKYFKTDKGKIANSKAQKVYYMKNKDDINQKRREKYKIQKEL
mgnify:FL=1